MMATWIWSYGRCRQVDDLLREWIRFYNYYVAKPPFTSVAMRWAREDESPVRPPVTLDNVMSRRGRQLPEDPGYRGVYPLWRTAYGRSRGSLGGGPRTLKWVVKFYDQVRGRLIHGGVFEQAEEAAKAWDRLAQFYDGDQATLNFPRRTPCE